MEKIIKEIDELIKIVEENQLRFFDGLEKDDLFILYKRNNLIKMIADYKDSE